MPNFIDQKQQDSARMSMPLQLPLSRMMTEINRKLSAGVDDKKLLDFVFDSLDLIIPYDRIGIAIVEGSGDESRLNLKWVRSKIPVTHLNVSYNAPIKGSSLQKILETNQPRVINDLVRYSAEHPESLSTKLVIKDGIRSNLTCPLRSEGRQIGVVFFSSSFPNTYQPEHVITFLEIADELSMIIEHGRLKTDSEFYSRQKQNLSMILHDLKSPLGTIQGFAEMSLSEPWFQQIDPEGKEVFQVFLRNSNYMFSLLNSLLEINHLGADSGKVNTQSVQLPQFLKEMANFGSVLADAKQIAFEYVGGAELPAEARFDRHKLQRVLDNLFTNAVKYSTRGRKVTFTVAASSGRLNFAVRDQGLGIPLSEQPLLFREFGKTSVRPTEGETSTGLGLAIAKKIVQQLGGEIKATSEVGKGSEFSFWIPLQ